MIKIEIIINNLRINYIKMGEGFPILIVPGWGTTIYTYMPLIKALSENFTVYCLDMPGFGKSEEPKNSMNVDNFVSLIIKFIESQNIKELALIGHSNGGRIIIKLMNAENKNFTVNKIVLMGSAGLISKKSWLKKIKVLIFKILKVILNIAISKNIFSNKLTKFLNIFGSEDYKNATPVLKETMVKLINEDMKYLLPNIDVPVLLIWGEKDTATPIEHGKIMEKLIPDAGLVELKGCSHYAFLEELNYVKKIIEVFLNGR